MAHIAYMPQPAHDLTRRYTVDDLQNFPEDGNKYEIIDGVLYVSPAPRLAHQQVLMRLQNMFYNYLEPFGLGQTVYGVAADISWGANTLVQPDMLVTRDKGPWKDWREIKKLRLAVEIISPSSRRYDREIKRRAYQKNGVELYWVVDIEKKHIEAWTPTLLTPTVYTGRIEWRHADSAEPLVIEVSALCEVV